MKTDMSIARPDGLIITLSGLELQELVEVAKKILETLDWNTE